VRIDRAELDGLATRDGFLPGSLEKVLRLGELLVEFGRHPLLRVALLLKGGTALNLRDQAPVRLSVDLDFNYVRAETREAMLADRPEIESAITRIARGASYLVQLSAEEHAGRKLFLSYRNAAGLQDRIEVDVNHLHRVPLADPDDVVLWQPGDYPRPRVRQVGLAELAAGKLCAFLDRAAPRDLFDAVRLPAIVGAAWGLQPFRSVFVALAGMLPHSVYSYRPERLERATDAAIEEQLHPMLARRADAPSGPELRSAAWRVMAPMLDLTDAEREFTDRLQRGELRPELIFGAQPGLAARAARHPGLLWKVENAAKRG
jgi:predicted nucleotidyltransferase component of viral defense system